MTTEWNGNDYQQRFDDLAAKGVDVHGEVAFLMRYHPASVLDAGCGTGRVAVELHNRGVKVVGADIDKSMLATARQLGPTIDWVEADLAWLELHQTFDIVVMAGNVPLFTPAGTHAMVVAGCARHIASHGRLVSGFQLGRGYELADYDMHCANVGLTLEDRFANWDGDHFPDGGSGYAVSVHAFA